MAADHRHHQSSASAGSPTLVFLPLPLVGHLVSMVELAKRLSPSFSITMLTTHGAPLPIWSSPSSAFLRRLQSSSLPIRLLRLPPVDFTPDPSAHGVTTMANFISAHKTHIKDYLSDLSLRTRIAGVVTEFVTSMVDAANELGLPAFVYFPSSAASLSTVIFPPPLPLISETDELVHVAGISPVPKAALPGAMAVPDGYETFTYHARRFREAKGVIINTFRELEPLVLDALISESKLPPIYTVGPLLSLPPPAADESSQQQQQYECMFRWLDQQPQRSVVFLCFGSMGCFEAEQVREIALGLERSGYRFLWTLRRKGEGPNSPPTDAVLEEDLPEGFQERTRGKGMVWPTWAPQLEVLLHGAVGGFVTHCGWNSCLEGVWAGVPMLAWPLYAEQMLNASEMVKDMGVAVEVRRIRQQQQEEEEGVLVGRDEVERGVRCLMGEDEEGRKVSEVVKAIRDTSRGAVVAGGSSSSAVERLVADLGCHTGVGGPVCTAE